MAENPCTGTQSEAEKTIDQFEQDIDLISQITHGDTETVVNVGTDENPIPVPSVAKQNSDLIESFDSALNTSIAQADRAGTEADRAETEADRAKSEADRAQSIVNIDNATEEVAGIIRIATREEVADGTRGDVAIPPSHLGELIPDASTTKKGIIELATQAEVDAGTDALKSVTPETLNNWSGGGGGSIPIGYINGGIMSASTLLPESGVEISAVSAKSDDGTTDIILPAGSLNILTSSDWASGTVPTFDSYFNPIMTSNTTPAGYIAFGDSNNAYEAFDRNNSTKSDSTLPSGQGGIIGMQAPNAYIANYVEIQADNIGDAEYPIDFTIEGSNDGVNYDILDTQTGQAFSLGETKTYPNGNTTPYSYYRINCTRSNDTGTTPMEISQLNFRNSQIEESYTVHVFATPAGFILDTSPTGDNITGAKRRVGSLRLDTELNIIPFICVANSLGYDLLYTELITDISTSPTTTQTAYDISVPTGVNISPHVGINLLFNFGTGTYRAYIASTLAPNKELTIATNNTSRRSSVFISKGLNTTTAQILLRITANAFDFFLHTLGYTDTRSV